CQQYKSLPCTF
nr:immunoglobulin light chain junction region [Macaca mulatta]